MGSYQAPLVALLLVALLGCTLAQFALPPLKYPFDGIEPNIDNETMFLHYKRHHNSSVLTLNKAVSERPSEFAGKNLHELLLNITESDDNVTIAIRNHGGSHFNHIMWWSTLRPTYRKAILPPRVLRNAINAVWGDFANFTSAFTAETSKLFGSGWVWLVYKPGKLAPSQRLAIVRTPNQDNPLMFQIVAPAKQGIPILGLDLWEHAFYLKHRNLRANYVPLWWQVVDWKRVQVNYQSAKYNRLRRLVGQ